MATIQQLIERFDNDYSSLVPTPKNYSGVSVIIPAFNTAQTLEKTLLAINNQDYQGGIQVIVADDGSTDLTEEMIKDIDVNFLIDYVKKPNENNRSKARNTGLALARYNIIFFFDGDVLPCYNYISKHVEMHNKYDKIVLVGFKEDIAEDSPLIATDVLKSKSKYRKLKPDYKKDWRYRKKIELTWKMQQYTLREPNEFVCELYKKTRGFKDFGKGKVIGVWDLACMVVTNNMSLKRKEILEVGAFDERFEGWGLEDTFLGAKLIANGNYIIPLIKTTCFHIKHKIDENKKVEEWKRNKELYSKLISEQFETFKRPPPTKEINLKYSESLGRCYKNFWEAL